MAVLTSPTLNELLVDVRNRLGQPSNLNSQWTDKELIGYLNEGIRRYFGEVVQNSEGQFTKTANLDIVSGTETVSTPSDFFEVRQLWKKIDNEFIILSYRPHRDESYTTQGTDSSLSYVPYYYLRGNDIVLRPTPNFSETAGLQLEYIHFPDTMVNGGDSLTSNVAPIFRDLIRSYAVYQAKLKESYTGNNINVHSAAQSQVADLYQQFKDVIVGRSHGPQAIKPFNPSEFD